MAAAIPIPRPSNETERLTALHRYRHLDTVSEKDFDLLTRVAAHICGVPYALISLVDDDHVSNLAAIGLPDQTVSRDEALCSWTILQDNLLEIPDLRLDDRTAKLPVVSQGGIHMYAGTNLNTKDGFRIGTLCVLDNEPHQLTPQQRELLAGLARQVMALFELRENEQMLRDALAREHYLASIDSLTGLLNRRILFERFDNELERSRRYDMPLSVVLIDLDHFKVVNDKYGHAAGDAVLRKVGEIIRAGVRSIDIAGRYGGEELCVVLPETQIEGARTFAESLRKRIEAAIIVVDGHNLCVTASIGVATFRADRSEVHSMLGAADEAMYSAKRDGRNRVALA
jgi:diguanylate cyclase (GGDEF)-like protein